MLNDAAKAKVVSALQPLYADPDFANVVGDFNVSVNTAPITPPPAESEVVEVPKA